MQQTKSKTSRYFVPSETAPETPDEETAAVADADPPRNESPKLKQESEAHDLQNGSSIAGAAEDLELQDREDSDEQYGARARYELGVLPNIELLAAEELVLPEQEEINRNVALIENTLLEFDVEINVIDVQVGPTVTRYALQPHKADGSERIRLSKIASYSRDLSLALAAKRLRMETPVPGTNYMGIEVPNRQPGIVALRNVMQSEGYSHESDRADAALLIPLGRDVTGQPMSLDLAKNAPFAHRRYNRFGQICLYGYHRDFAADAKRARPFATHHARSQNGGIDSLQWHTASAGTCGNR